MLQLDILGPPAAHLNGQRLSLRPHRLTLLSLLALDGPQDRALLATLLYPDAEPDAARAKLRLELHRIRHSPLGHAVEHDGPFLHLHAHCDALSFTALLAEGRPGDALPLYRGELLGGLDWTEQPALHERLTAHRERLSRLHVQAFTDQLAHLDAQGRAREALDLARARLAARPYAEDACDALTRRLAAHGQLGEALLVQENFRAAFQAELGVPPQLTHDLTPGRTLTPPDPAHTAPGTADLHHPPLVGREPLWRQLETWVDRAPPLGVLLLVGESGVGKSRLAGAFGRARGRVVVLRGAEASQHAPFHALAAAFRQAAPQLLRALDPGAQAAVALLDVPADTPPDTHPAALPLSETQLVGSLTRAALGLMAQADTVIVDDLHWLDASSLRVLLRAREQAGTLPRPPRLICTARPAELAASAPLSGQLGDLERQGQLHRLDVPPLTELSVLTLLRQLSGSSHAIRLAAKLHALSGGNPYTVLTYLHGLRSRGLFQEAAHAHASAPAGDDFDAEVHALEDALPGTLRELLLSEVRAAGPGTLALLQAGALQRQPFDLQAVRVAAFPDLPPAGQPGDRHDHRARGCAETCASDRAETALTRALEHRWVQPTPDGRYRLQHDLLRRVLLSALPGDEVRALHRRMAEHLDATPLPGPDHAPTDGPAGHLADRAHHWQGAGHLDRAAPLWTQVAARAKRLWAHREALHALERALECTPDPAGRLALHLQRGRHHQALNALGPWEEELGRAAALLDAHPQLRDAHGARYALERTHLLTRLGRQEDALTFSAAWLDVPWTPDVGLLMTDRASILMELDRLTESRAALDALLALQATHEFTVPLRANLHSTYARLLTGLDPMDPALGLTHTREALALYAQMGSDGGLITANLYQAAFLEEQADLSGAILALEAALNAAGRSGNARLGKYTLTRLVTLTEQARDWDAATRHATAGIELAETQSDEPGITYFSGVLHRLKRERVRPVPP